MIKQDAHVVKGMQRDLTVSKFSSEFVFDAQNIRITARDNNTLLSVTNEKGNKRIVLVNGNAIVELQGIVIGYNVLNNYLTLFTTDNATDRIYRLERKDDNFECITLYIGSLNFNTEYPIESIGVYENENIQKVYWIDGRNQARVINIVASYETRGSWDDGSFDFVQELKLEETITVSRNDTTSGIFAAGAIQYAFTYYNMYGQESNIFYTTPLQYISYSTRGASAEDSVSNSFTITIENPDTRFDYIRIYSIHRTSLDATPTVTNVVDLAIDSNDTLTYVDTGTTGSTVDATGLLYVGGSTVIPQTMTHKDNTLFLGNILLDDKLVSESLRDSIGGLNVSYSYKEITETLTDGEYPWENSLNLGETVRGFHSNEWYRFGLQFQYKTGKWSEVVFIGDYKNSLYRPTMSTSIYQVMASTTLSSTIIQEAVDEGFIRARGVVVYPSISDREALAQGILCPTVYNIEDRQSNSPFAQSSWFSRPSQAIDIDSQFIDNEGEVTADWTDIITGESYSIDSRAGIVGFNTQSYWSTNTNQNILNKELPNRGSWAEFRHNYPIPDNVNRNAEIQCITNAPSSPTITLEDSDNEGDIAMWVANHREYFYIDQSVITMHSPEFEFDDAFANIDTTNLKLRIVGRVLMTGNTSDVDIQTESNGYLEVESGDNTYVLPGFYKEKTGTINLSYHGLKSLISAPLYMDWVSGDVMYGGGFLVYPWHRSGPLNNSYDDESEDLSKNAVLSQKKMSNLKFSAITSYLSSPWYAEEEGSNTKTGIAGVGIFNSEEQALIRLPAPENSGLSDINYYGNIDKVVTVTRIDEEYQPTYSKDTPMGHGGTVNLYPPNTSSPVPEYNDYASSTWDECNKIDGYPIVAVGLQNYESTEWVHYLFTGIPTHLYSWVYAYNNTHRVSGKAAFATDPVSIKYKSTPHAVIVFNYTKDNRQVALPTTINILSTINSVSTDFADEEYLPWDTTCRGIYQDAISVTSLPYYGYLWLGELYNDNVVNRFGGDTQEAIENNTWLPAGDPVLLIDGYDENNSPIAKTTTVTVPYTVGDTFFERYDCLKTYPYTTEDVNSVVEIVSFYCESRINLDGRYDRNRGQVNNLTMTPANFNLMNPVYNQTNNYFSYTTINYDRYNLDYFPNTITWAEEKSAGALVDTWTNITMASTLDLDGDKGEITSLNVFNNEIYCFQEKGLSNILFNSRVQIPTSDEAPIEITNGLKVSGKRYISNTMGCNNKWSIVESPSGLYFIDNITNSIYLFNGEVASLADKLGFKQWIGKNNSLDKWDPVSFNNFVSYYDKNNGDVYFVNNDTALVYSELLGQFTSFMSYGGVPAMFNINNDFYAVQDNKIWEQFAGDYNKIFGEYCPYSITFISNAESAYDKIFNNIEFRADCWTKDSEDNEILGSNTFDTLEVWNEYQKGVSTLNNLTARPSPLKKKFRVWRANIPRANTDWNGVKANKLDRIRNTWAYVKLARNEENTDRMEFHDMIVHYFV